MTRDDFLKHVETEQGVILPLSGTPMFLRNGVERKAVVNTLMAILPDAEEVVDGWETQETPTVWVLVLRYELLVLRVDGESRGGVTVTATRHSLRGIGLGVVTRHEHLPGQGTLLRHVEPKGLPDEVAGVRADKLLRLMAMVTAAKERAEAAGR
jgi:hypothetical protein